jgi:hypothetical protein
LDHRVKPGDDDFQETRSAASQPISLNRTDLDLIRPSTCPTLRQLATGVWITGSSPVMTI